MSTSGDEIRARDSRLLGMYARLRHQPNAT